MDIRILTLLVLIGVLGSFTEARSAYYGYPNIRNGGLRAIFAAPTRLKRAVDSNGETTTSQATTTTTPSSTTPDSTTDPTTTEPTTTEPPTTTDPPTDPTTTPASTTTEATSPTTEATSPTTEATSPTTEATSPTTEATTPTTEPSTTPTTTGTTPSTSATTPATTTSATTPESSTTPESTTPTPKPEKPKGDFLSRSDFDDSNKPEETTEKPEPPSDSNKTPAPGPYYGYPSYPYTPYGPFGPSIDPYFGYPGFNSIPGSGPNYAWTGTSGGPGFSAAGASAGASTFGYPGMGYPMTGFPSAGSPTVDNRGGFQDNSPNVNGYPGYGSGGIDPLYGSGFYFPGQFPNYNDPYEMFRQIQSQIEAQHRAFAQHVASLQASIVNQGRPYVPNVSNYPYISSDMNNLGVRGMYNAVYQNSRFGNSNMEFHNRLASEAANYDGAQLASASIGIGPSGGFQAGQISPAAPGIESRFADELPPPSGNSYGVFASSSSSSMTGPDGKQINHKISTTGVNDNGNISYRTVHDK